MIGLRNAARCAVACLAMASAAAEPDPRTLVARLARDAPSSIVFTEARFSSLLRRPVVVSGELGYLGAGSLDRRVTSPYRETTTIRGSAVRIERDGQDARSFALERAPDLAGFLSAFGALLGGDSSALEQTFALAAKGDADGAWTLELTPLDERARRRDSVIAIYGSSSELHCVATIDGARAGSVVLLGARSSGTVPPDSSLDDLLAHCRTP